MPAEYRNNHLTQKAYLAQWAGEDGRLRRVKKDEIRSEPKKPERVGYRKYFWGRDPGVRRRAEEVTNRFETKAAPILRDLPEIWPLKLGSPEWFAVSMFLGLHLLRNPAGPRRLLKLQKGILDSRLPNYTAGWSEEQTQEFLHYVTSDDFRVQILLNQAVKAACMLGSMHWTLLEFPVGLLATSDQPVALVPLLGPGASAPVQPLPDGPMFDAEEVRMAIGPCHALLLTWLDEPCLGPVVRAGDDIAVAFNRVVIGQADQEWFHHPARRPTTLNPGLFTDTTACGAVGRLLLPGYSYEAALASSRRMRAIKTLDRMVEDGVDDRVEIVSVEPQAA